MASLVASDARVVRGAVKRPNVASLVASDARVVRGAVKRPKTMARSDPRSWKERVEMPSKPKPEQVDEAIEQARRALQTSMDTRQ